MINEFGEKIAGIEYKKRPGAYGILLENGRIGVVKSDEYGDYFLVGGGIDGEESETEALHREAREEIGFEIEIGEKISEAVEYFFSESEKRYVAKECNFYLVSLVRKAESKAKHELVWITKDEIGELHHISYRWIVEKLLIPF